MKFLFEMHFIYLVLRKSYELFMKKSLPQLFAMGVTML